MRRSHLSSRRAAGGPLIRNLSVALVAAAAFNVLFVLFNYDLSDASLSTDREAALDAYYISTGNRSLGHIGGGGDGRPTATDSRPPGWGWNRTGTDGGRLKPKATIGYAISATSCEQGASGLELLQGAAVLGHSIRLSSIENPNSGSRYAHKLYAFLHPYAADCADAFRRLGYEVQICHSPINVTQIRNPQYREDVDKQSCCGAKEFIKLYSYLLGDHPVVVHQDLDSLVLKPLDDLFDAMIDGPGSPARARLPVMFNATLPDRIEAFFTRDYNMVDIGHRHVGVQGGFLVVRPSKEAFEEYRELILEGNFVPEQGWEGKYGGYYGAKQIQGLCSYFFDGRHPNTAVELNRCIYNQMVDDPRRIRRSDNKRVCIDGTKDCEDCRRRDVSDVVSAHFCEPCGKPWHCLMADRRENGPLCRELRRKWFQIRKDLEESNVIPGHVPTEATGTFEPEIYFGYCHGYRRYTYMHLFPKNKTSTFA